MRIQFWHIIVLILVVLLLFGSAKLPDLARSVGKSMKIFKSEVQELRDDSTSSSATGSGTPQPGPGAEQGRRAGGNGSGEGVGDTGGGPGDRAAPQDTVDPGRRER